MVVHGGLLFRAVQTYPEGGCVPAGTPTLKSVEEGVGDIDEEALCQLGASTTCSFRRSKFVEICRGEKTFGEMSRIFARNCRTFIAIPVRSSRLFTPAMSAFEPLDSSESWPLDQSNGPDDSGVSSLSAFSTSPNFFAFHSSSFLKFLKQKLLSSSLDITFAISTSVMAEGQASALTSNVDGDDYTWVADEPRTTISKFSLNGGDGMFRTVQRPPTDDWKTCIPNTNRRICSKFQWGSFPMYQIAFEHMGYRLPFSDFEVAVFRYLHLTPSQLHPNSLAFIRAFEMTVTYLGFLPTIPLFFHAFHLQRSKPKGCTGAPFVGPDGRPVMEDYSPFPLSWRKSHYLKPASDFIYSAEELTVEELSDYEQMKVFVSGFPRKLTDFFFVYFAEEMSTIAAKLRKSKAAKEKRQAVVLGSSSNAAPSPEGDVMNNARRSAVVVDLEDAVVNANADNQPRPTKVARVEEVDASSTGRALPSNSRFVLPPAIGSPGLVKKSSASISDAEKAIMDDMGPEALKNELTDAMVSAFKLMEISSYLNGRECKYLAERDSAKEEVALLRQSLEQAKVNHAAYREKFKLQAGLVTQLTEKEQESARLTVEKEKLEGQVRDLTAEKKTLEGKVKVLESRSGSSNAASDFDELVVDPNVKSSFDNVVAQLMVLNPGVDLVVEGASELKEVQDGVIVSPALEED
ncbi:hypothetical protein TSUD_248880 [Trifolium subterraneum]|uniref:Transposase (putative) gypsy type domain-containing protein n=1 Tax=Trifolium subterraneum TaxID=3900 RepID=A0A2Z6MIP1_TRISU|nr:hypothetical protein TSUD_248880 [Trifolium subterraneum]